MQAESLTLVGRYEDDLIHLSTAPLSSKVSHPGPQQRDSLNIQRNADAPDRADHFWDWIFGGSRVEQTMTHALDIEEMATVWKIRSRKVVLMVSDGIEPVLDH
jgi:hypothetical protein